MIVADCNQFQSLWSLIWVGTTASHSMGVLVGKYSSQSQHGAGGCLHPEIFAAIRQSCEDFPRNRQIIDAVFHILCLYSLMCLLLMGNEHQTTSSWPTLHCCIVLL